ncbi:RNA helicase [Thiohalorhabdus denitrificans]|uniref:SNF2 family N-terminal domain-containing protein n=1 Tax=Thiohalorhabdus denitrificans TaxID=381306 RepID=A0A0P9C4K7_9GAMM|nr:helicase-related protein [Thiohalorhabdus denitrificans]KPV39924.1 RNA helicase [Thiohalorhabdus denitrificans]SCY08660.1 protein of unknown function [Thiohalorhabdus denitrificans]
MVKLEDLKKDAQVRGLAGNEVVKIVSSDPVGEGAVTVVYRTGQGQLGEQMVFRSDEPNLELAEAGRPWAFDASPEAFKLGLEAYRINMAHLFDPMMAVHTADVQPLPHQISAVYEEMLPRQPLRFVLADDPGAGKTIMAGLYIRELIMRADAHRILVVAPGGLVEQWQDELFEKFGLEFRLFNRDVDQASRTGNAFQENERLIARLDQLARNEDFQEKLENVEWDLVVVDEAHKMSATYFGNKLHETKRYKLGKLLGQTSRHLLLMTATPHNGKEEDFQLFMGLLDEDRFYGKFREGAHQVDVTDLMRRMVKEDLVRFDGTPLFPERYSYTVNYELSDPEYALYAEVTDYVREEMNRAQELEGKRKGTVGFALTQLQRRLASSPEAIYQSLSRRRKRLEEQRDEMKTVARGHQVSETLVKYQTLDVPENIDEADEELPSDEYEAWSEQVVDKATAAETAQELEAEIQTLRDLEGKAKGVRDAGADRKWEELSELLQDKPEMYTQAGQRRKIIIFTEHRDTLNYLRERITGLLGRSDAVVTIHGGTNRDERRKIQEEFRHNPEVLVLLGTDAAGEGINLQNTNLMVNYDLPWNPNRLEQRFGRIHRIGQEDVCHLWNMVASGTREGQVFQRLFEKLETERETLGGQVFDVLGEAFEDASLKDLLLQAIQYGDQPEVQERLNQAIDSQLDSDHLKAIMDRNALAEEHLSTEELFSVKEEMEKAEARKLQPHFVRAFFNQAFQELGGELRPRESGRAEIRHVPAKIRERDRVIGQTRTPVLKRYQRVCFDKDRIHLPKKPTADLIHPAHPLMAATTDLILEDRRSKLKQGSVLVDPEDPGTEPRVVFMLEHTVREGAGDPPRVVSRRVQFVALDPEGNATFAGWAPHLDMRALEDGEKELVSDIIGADWVHEGLESQAMAYAGEHLVPEHFQEVKNRRERRVEKVLGAVHERLVKEINYWSGRAIELERDVEAGKQPRMQPDNARRRAEELSARLEERRKGLEAQRNVVANSPAVVGGALIIPYGLIAQRRGEADWSADAAARERIEQIAMEAVRSAEENMGHRVQDVSSQKCGWDLTAQPPEQDGRLPEARHIEVKGRAKGQTTITVSRNEIAYALNQADKFLLAIVLVDEADQTEGPYYLRQPFSQEPEFGVASVNYDLADLLEAAISPSETLQEPIQ